MKKKQNSKKLFRTGYVRFNGLGGFPEKLISNIIKDNISIWQLTQGKASISGNVAVSDYSKVSRMGKKYGVRIRVAEKHGFFFKINPYRKRWGLVVGSVCCVGIIAILSSFIWDVEVSGNEKLSSVQICNVLEQIGISQGVQRLSFNTNACEIKAKLLLDDIAWISIEREGSRVYAKINERVKVDEPDIPIDVPCNIVADFDGQLITAEVYKGTLNVQKGSGVYKGQLLVSGAVADGGGNMLYLHADGNFIAECVEEQEFYMPFTKTELIPNGETTQLNYALIFGYTIPLFFSEPDVDYNNITYKEETKNTTLFNFTTPLKFRTGYYTEYTKQEVTRTNSDLITILEQQKQDYEENFLADAEIVKAEKEFIPEKDGIRLKITYTLRKQIGKKQEISIYYENNS